MFKLFQRVKKEEVFACVIGEYVPLREVKDEVFSKGLIGLGCGIEPKDQTICSPIQGSVTMIFPTKHAIGLKTDLGVEILLHIGIDTVMMKGDGFELLIKENDQVKVGQPLVRVDFDKVKDAGHQKTVLMIATNTNNMELQIVDESSHPVTLKNCLFTLEGK